MNISDEIFQNKIPNFYALKNYGFKENKGEYSYCAAILNGQFELRIKINKKGKISDKIIDLAQSEEYILYKLQGASGEFLGKIKEEYKKILEDISKKCFEANVFKSRQAKFLIKYIKENYGNELEFLWEKFKGNAIVRRKDNSKWYIIFLTLNKSKLISDENKIVEIIDLRAQPDKIDEIIDNKTIFRGYHMNKKHWFTICLDESIPDEIIVKYLNESYELAGKNKSKPSKTAPIIPE